jgi:rare lipoprotein A
MERPLPIHRSSSATPDAHKHVAAAATAQASAHPDRPRHPYVQVGIASWYGPRRQGRLTASGEVFDMHKLTAAHRTLPLPTRARVTNLENGKSVDVRINDRGPAIKSRVIDLSEEAAQKLGMKEEGLALVRIEVLPPPATTTTADSRSGAVPTPAEPPDRTAASADQTDSSFD